MTVRPFARKLVAVLAAFGLAGHASAQQAALAKLEVFPPDINLSTARDRQSFVVQATYADGITRDVTAEANVDARPTRPSSAATGTTFHPVADGDDRADGRVRRPDGRRSRSRSRRPTVQPPISFKLDVMPVFMRAGCNTGSCHGAARGKDGFRLSLFGFDPDGDHYRLTREMSGRRVNLALPAESTARSRRRPARCQHTGGKRFEPASELLPDARSAGSRPAPPTTTPTKLADRRRRRALPQARRCSTARARRSR